MKILTLIISSLLLLIKPCVIQAQDGTVKSFVKITKNNSGFSGIDFKDKRFLGRALTNIGDIDKDGITDIAVSCTDINKLFGTVIICFLNKDGSIKSTCEITDGKGGLPVGFTPSNISGFGESITGIGDFDKDGVNDIVVGNYGLTTTFEGEIFILYLNKNGTVKKYLRIAEGVNGFLGQLNSKDQFGCAISSIGDIDNDGVIDLAVGAMQDNDAGILTGAVWILFLKSDGNVKSYKKLNKNTIELNSLHKDEYFGKSIANIGDLNKDGVNDIIVGGYRSNDGGPERGSLRLLFLNSDGSIKKVSKINSTNGNFTDSLKNGAFFSWALSSLGDIDGDTIMDITVSSISYNVRRGAIWNIFLSADGSCKSIQKITSDTGGFNVKLNPNDEFGVAVTSVGDLNSDGISDVISASLSDDEAGDNAGAFYILFLNGKPQSITPIASFTQSKDTIKINECVNFKDISNNIPTSWKWIFQGGNPSSSTLQNPSNICFSSAGKYTMTMIATNSKGSDTATKTIVVKDPAGLGIINNLSVQIIPNPFSYNTTIHTGKYHNNSSLHVYNTQGQLIKQLKNISGQEVTFNREELQAGLYYFKLIQANNELTTGKLIITE